MRKAIVSATLVIAFVAMLVIAAAMAVAIDLFRSYGFRLRWPLAERLLNGRRVGPPR